MDIRLDLAAAVGHTPLIRLRAASLLTGCEVLAKCEFANPGGSIKDRTALGLLLDAEKSGALQRGSVIVEGTAGNTGIGLALLGASRGYRTIIAMPLTQSREKIDALRVTGAQVQLVDAVPYANPAHYAHVARRIASDMNARTPGSAWFANQFENTANYEFHRATTGPEIFEQTGGAIDGFVCSTGTGGTLAGVGLFLKSQKVSVKIALADPAGSALAHYVTCGELKSDGNSITEGIGSSRITANFAAAPIDMAWTIADSESLPLVHALLQEEGLNVGGSSGVNVAGAIRLARELGPGHTIVTLLADSGTRYQAKLFNPQFLHGKKLAVPEWLERAFPST